MASTATPADTSAPPPPPSAPTDPSVAQQTPTGAYPLSLNDLTSLVAYHAHPAGLSIRSLVALPAGSVFTKITTSTPAPVKRWSTVQTSESTHIELNSALLYMNHSCDPSLEINVKSMEIRVARGKDLKQGDELSFFYPSTEWAFDNPFKCLCGSKGCLGEVKGAKYISKQDLDRWFVNDHILALKAQDAQ
ncbi:Histone-lysine N-methyltransferase, H3 lysine-4 specific [Sphaceloma murrayae]|uniref:Histone-lysine N-methyltransferase, H3 lysine-4 specific n=1 Tax=Sphaceloma murrayae TaxID=2082308 RepID=A0A2K1QKU8_9PEZI|nr:Histone-lysine N-methyltransferase, H3 lysine-4 specific [Sphaceloma murrayae]